MIFSTILRKDRIPAVSLSVFASTAALVGIVVFLHGHAAPSIRQNFPVQTAEDIFADSHSAAPSASAEAMVIPESHTPLTERSLALTITADSRAPVSTTIHVSDHPDWVYLESGYLGSRERIDRDAVKNFLEQTGLEGAPLLQNAGVLSTELDHKNVRRAETTGIAKAGYAMDTAAVAESIADALEQEKSSFTVDIPYRDPVVDVTMSDGTKKTLTLLGAGLSDFAGSTPGRDWNVHKVINERVNNIIVPAGEVFSLVDALDAPISLRKGWKQDLGLVGGGAALMLGAGICQSATTLFRAVLMSGLPVVKKKNHSLFVNHYELFGVGLDATVFPGEQDFRFKNDTGDDLLMQASIDGPTVRINFFGRNDGRTTTLQGPYFAKSKNRPPALRPLSIYQIGWVRTVTFSDGRSTLTEPIVSSYGKPVWRSIVKKFDGADGMKLLLAVAE